MKKLMKVLVMVMAMMLGSTTVSAAAYELTDGSSVYKLTAGARKQTKEKKQNNKKTANKSAVKKEKLETVSFNDSGIFGSDAELYVPHKPGAITGYTECFDKNADMNKVIGAAIQEFESTTNVDPCIGTSFSMQRKDNVLEYKLISLSETCFITVDVHKRVVYVIRITH